MSCRHLVALVLAVVAPVSADTTAAERSFSVEIRPLLARKCFVCHDSSGVRLGGLDLTSRESMLAGGSSGESVLSPGNADGSLLYSAVTWEHQTLQMPPKENDRLDQRQVDLIRDWISAGAPWPDERTQARYIEKLLAEEDTATGIRVPTSGGGSADWTNRRYKPEDLWAYQPIRQVDVPAGAENPIDGFHRTRLQAVGLQPAPDADKLTLVRRAHFDLTGLPPSPDEVEAFLQDDSPAAWERLIDRLLASPRYGERWGQHWLDVARYADTAGNSNDFERSNAWRYRDYVIRSLNRDKPYDQFVIEQIAGDELAPDDPEMLIATGFLRMGPWGSAMIPKKIARQAYLDDVVNSVGQTFLATPLRCAKCHDHKFDPIPTRDYYRFYAVFAGTQIAERPAPFLPEENLNRFAPEREHVERLLSFATERKEALEAKMDAADREWYASRGQSYVPPKERKEIADSEKPPRHYGLDYQEEGRLKVRQQDEWIWKRRLERYEPLAQTVFNGPDYVPTNERRLRVPEDNDLDWRPSNAIYAGGDVNAATEPVTPGVLSVIPRQGAALDRWAITEDLLGRRLELARWIADEDNPLTARVIVNRVWQGHFGQGIAATSNNFGVSGAKPTHPELLDWLAKDFLENGWKLKRLHRLIMTSKAYRQSSERSDINAIREKDPNNELFAYFEPRRLSAEELRDAMLAISGELNSEMGGLPIMPEINMEVALQPRMIQFSIAPAHQPSRTPAERNRRSIYAYRVRGQADPFLAVFDQPTPNESCERRDAPSVSPQALTLMNSDFAIDRSIAFAQRLEREAGTLERRIDRAYTLAYGRLPSAERRERLATFVKEMEAHHRAHEPVPQHYPTTVTRSLVEEFTGKPFEYEEILNRFEDYAPDVKAWQVEPETRALADLCLLLYNSNELLYVD